MKMQHLSARWMIVFAVMAFAFAVSPLARAVTIVSGPSFTPAANAPLAGVLTVTSDVPSTVSVVVSDGTSLWERDFYDFSTNHSETLLGFHPGRTNLILVTVFDANQNAATAAQVLKFVTAPLPSNFPTSVVLKDEPDKMEPGYTLFMVQNRSAHVNYIDIIDNTGQVVWYMPAPYLYDVEVRQLDNGDLFEVNGIANRFLEINMLGTTVNHWNAPAGYPVDEHEGLVTDHGTILYLSTTNRVINNFPTSVVNPSAPKTNITATVNLVVEMSMTNSALLHVWSVLDMLDPTHITYLTYENSGGNYPGAGSVDFEHGNAILEDTNDNSIILSLRNQNTVFKFTRSGQVKWILSPPQNWGANFQQYLLNTNGTSFEWSYGQHAPMLSPQGTLFVYDDGNYRASPFDADAPIADQNNYSRGVEYSINETNMQVSQVWDTTLADEDRLYTGIVGKTQWLPQTRDVLVTYGYVMYINGIRPSSHSPNATMVRIIEYTHDPIPQVVFDLSFFDYSNTSPSYLGYFVYRATRIPGLYAHPGSPVTDLVVNEMNNAPSLQFSADPTRTYAVQASSDLLNWTTIGTAVQDGGVGKFSFHDLDASQFNVRYYRILTQ